MPKGLSSLWKVKVSLMGSIVHGAYGFFDTFQWAHGSSFTISGQNKNRYMLGFLAMLVHLGVFRKIKLSFLMVGHTHEDIDQLFS
ncbi:hypothetical protein MAR_021437, partial [Mya arenaria]